MKSSFQNEENLTGWVVNPKENWYVVNVTGPIGVAQVQSDQHLWSGDRCNSFHTIVYRVCGIHRHHKKIHKFNNVYPTLSCVVSHIKSEYNENMPEWFYMKSSCSFIFVLLYSWLYFMFSREVTEKDAKDYADSIHAIFVETSAKNAININEIFIQISESIFHQLLARVHFKAWKI